MKENILIIPDLHIPFEHKNALEFCCDVYKKYNCKDVIQLGDLVDQYCFSRFVKNCDSFKALDEVKLAISTLKKWQKKFNKITITQGNHCIRLYKRANEIGISKYFIKTLNEIFELSPNWKYVDEVVINNIKIFHGCKTTENAAEITAKTLRQSVIVGHAHRTLSIKYYGGENPIFGVCAGCLINKKQYAFEYAKEMLYESALGCVVLKEKRLPILIPLE